MDKELVINGIKYIRVDENNYKIGDTIKYNGYEWYIIKLVDNKATLLMKNCLSEDEMQEIFADEYLDNDNDVVFNLDKSNNDWCNSIIRERLNNTFIDKFNKVELNIMKTNYDEDKYSNDYIRLATIREIEKFGNNIRQADRIYWTMSPSNFNSASADAYVWYVYSTGNLGYIWVTDSNGVRPVINVNVDYLDGVE